MNEAAEIERLHDAYFRAGYAAERALSDLLAEALARLMGRAPRAEAQAQAAINAYDAARQVAAS